MESAGGTEGPGEFSPVETGSQEDLGGVSETGMDSTKAGGAPTAVGLEGGGPESSPGLSGGPILGTGRIVGMAAGSLLLYLVMERLPMMGGVVGLIGGTAGLFSPTPVVQIFLRWGSRAGFVALLGVALALVTIGSWGSALQYLATVGVVAWVLAIAITSGKSVERAVGWSMLGVAAGMGILYGVQVFGFGWDIATSVIGPEGERAIQQMSGAAPGPAGEDVVRLIRVMGRLMPAIVVVNAALLSVLNYSLVRYLWTLRGSNNLFPKMDLYRWSMPEVAVWLLIGSGVLLFFVWGGTASWVLANVLLVLLIGYFLQGLAVVHFWCRCLNVSLFLRIPLYCISIALSYVVAAIGLFDLWFDFRKLRVTGTPNGVGKPDAEDSVEEEGKR